MYENKKVIDIYDKASRYISMARKILFNKRYEKTKLMDTDTCIED